MAVTVDHLSGGRLEFGLGAGWAENEHTMLGLAFGTRGTGPTGWRKRCRSSGRCGPSRGPASRASITGCTEAVAEPKPVQRPYPPIWIGGSGRKRTLRIAARYADVWNAAGGGPKRWPRRRPYWTSGAPRSTAIRAEIRRSVQLRVGVDELDQVRATADGYVKVGVTDFLLIVHGADPVAIGEQLAAQLSQLRELG